LKDVIDKKLLSATTDTSFAVSNSDVVVVVVPLFVDKDANPDFLAMDQATIEIAKGLKPGTLISYETTLPVGTTRNRLTPLLVKGTGLIPGTDFFVVFSPERVLTGRVFEDLRRYPKLVGGIDEISEKRGLDFYSQVLDFDDRPDLHKQNGVWAMGSTEASEMAKLAETTGYSERMIYYVLAGERRVNQIIANAMYSLTRRRMRNEEFLGLV
jgi:UDP-N-acetyl-D-mannosaminuronate dehydrogenase